MLTSELAGGLGVLEDDGPTQGSLNIMMQSLNRFLLSQTINDHKAVYPQEEFELPGVRVP